MTANKTRVEEGEGKRKRGILLIGRFVWTRLQQLPGTWTRRVRREDTGKRAYYVSWSTETQRGREKMAAKLAKIHSETTSKTSKWLLLSMWGIEWQSTIDDDGGHVRLIYVRQEWHTQAGSNLVIDENLSSFLHTLHRGWRTGANNRASAEHTYTHSPSPLLDFTLVYCSSCTPLSTDDCNYTTRTRRQQHQTMLQCCLVFWQGKQHRNRSAPKSKKTSSGHTLWCW